MQLRTIIRLPLKDIFTPLWAMGDTLHHHDKTERSKLMQAEEEEFKSTRVEIKKVLDKHQYMVVLGNPGAGKTTLLKYIALSFAEGKDVIKERLCIDKQLLPIILPISSYARAINDKPNLSLSDYLPSFFRDCKLPDLKPLFGAELKKGNCILLLDGLDEVISEYERAQIVKKVKEFISTYSNNHFVITSRIAGYKRGYFGNEFTHFTILDFNDEDIERFVYRWCYAYETIDGVTKQAVKRAQERANQLVDAILETPNIKRLASNPLLLTILTLIHYQGTRLPQQRVELYRLCVEALAHTWNLARSLSKRPIDLWLGDRILDEEYVVNILGPIAYWMHETSPGGVIKQAELEDKIAKYLEEQEGVLPTECSVLAEDFIKLCREYVGLLVERGTNLYGFLHLTFEEYLSARYLAERSDVNKLIIDKLKDTRWQEVILLTSAILKGDYRKGLISNLLDINLKGKDKGRNIIVAGLCLIDIGKSGVGMKLYNMGIEKLVALLDDSQVSINNRIEAGNILGELGDPRIGKMIEIPEGEFIMGSDEYDDERPVHKVFIDAFKIDKYPVTNEQFEKFVNATNYVTDAEKRGDETTWRTFYTFKKRNHPVVYVSWNDAQSYAKWAGKRLPTEAEWEKAARGTDGRRYPWGDEFDKNKCNTGESEIDGTTPVGIYPDGKSPYGVMDMAGNVWEWCEDWYDENYYEHSPRTNPKGPESGEFRVLRGGSWYLNQHRARCSSRSSNHPNDYWLNLGFRCAEDIP
jgi:formylglycine-generating enzyme required for sulfatase activity